MCGRNRSQCQKVMDFSIKMGPLYSNIWLKTLETAGTSLQLVLLNNVRNDIMAKLITLVK